MTRGLCFAAEIELFYDFDFLIRSQLLLLGKVEYGGGPIFKVVLEC